MLDVFWDDIPPPPCVGPSTRSFCSLWNVQHCIVCYPIVVSEVAKSMHPEMVKLGIRVGQHGCGPLPDLLTGDLLFPSDAQNPLNSGVEPGVEQTLV